MRASRTHSAHTGFRPVAKPWAVQKPIPQPVKACARLQGHGLGAGRAQAAQALPGGCPCQMLGGMAVQLEAAALLPHLHAAS